MNANRSWIENLVMRIQGDFLATPGLTLTLKEAERRFGIDEIACNAVLTALVDANVLARNRDGAYLRRFPRLVGGRARVDSPRRHQPPPMPRGAGRFTRRAA
jgi:hypothetical protein